MPGRDEQVWVGPLRHPVDDSPIMVLAGAAYVGNTPDMLVAARVAGIGCHPPGDQRAGAPYVA
ncbi:hypothetical protein N234_31480 [Ralstonia pickettii DTP0602]|nr:hypothetical protein N234_31480 [Ralstonia pickettii DTP0602]